MTLPYPDNLLYDIFGCDWEFTRPADFDGSLEYVLHSLTERERRVLDFRYKDGLTFEAIGKRECVTRERARQIYARALRKLCNPQRLNYLKYGVSGVIARQTESAREAALASLPKLDIKMGYNDEGEQRMFLNGEDVSAQIRMPEISLCASDVAALPSVRAFLLGLQRKTAEESNVIMDGRDIGTVVLPDADLKVFLTASAEARANRRLLELTAKGVNAGYDDVLRDIMYRDEQDSQRASAPLKQAEDAILADTTELDFEESFRLLCDIVVNKLSLQTED